MESAPKLVSDASQIYPTPRAQRLMENARSEAVRLNDDFIGAEHLFIAAVMEPQSVSAEILKAHRVDRERVYQALIQVRGSHRVDDPDAESRYRSCGEVILFLDELHTMVGAVGSEGDVDASNMLKPALSRGEMQCVRATTLDEYRKYIERDSALERRFQPVYLEEPSVDETVEILKILRPRYEAHHKVDISDAALVAATRLSDRYISGRQLPEKAIDFVDEAATKIRIDAQILPAPLKELAERIRYLNDQEIAAAERLEYERAAELRREMLRLQAEYDAERQAQQAGEETQSVVDGLSIAQLVSDWTGIPTGRLLEG